MQFNVIVVPLLLEGMARWLSESESYLIEEVSTNFLLKSREGESTLPDDRGHLRSSKSLKMTLLFDSSVKT